MIPILNSWTRLQLTNSAWMRSRSAPWSTNESDANIVPRHFIYFYKGWSSPASNVSVKSAEPNLISMMLTFCWVLSCLAKNLSTWCLISFCHNLVFRKAHTQILPIDAQKGIPVASNSLHAIRAQSACGGFKASCCTHVVFFCSS